MVFTVREEKLVLDSLLHDLNRFFIYLEKNFI